MVQRGLYLQLETLRCLRAIAARLGLPPEEDVSDFDVFGVLSDLFGIRDAIAESEAEKARAKDTH